MEAALRIAHVELSEGGGPLAGPVSSARARWTERRGIVLQLRDDQGHVGEGEASPLPGYSVESLEQCRAVLGAVPWDRLVDGDLTRDPVPEVHRALELVPPGSPSARFAVETALFDLVGQRLGAPVHRLLARDRKAAPVPLCALVPGDGVDETVRAAERAVDAGMTVLKLKIGGAPEQDIRRAQAVRRAVGASVLLRFDANRSVPVDRLDWMLHALAEVRAELVEEPAPPERVEALERIPVALAADESLSAPEDRERVSRLTGEGRYAVWVLKPAALGGACACLRLADEARRSGAEVVTSHLFDGPIAWAAALELALAHGGDRAVGLAPHPGLSAWPERVPASAGASSVVPHRVPGLGLRGDR